MMDSISLLEVWIPNSEVYERLISESPDGLGSSRDAKTPLQPRDMFIKRDWKPNRLQRTADGTKERFLRLNILAAKKGELS